LTQNFHAYRRVRVRKTDSSVSSVTGLRAGGSVNRFVILDRVGFCVFYRLHADSGPRCDAFQKFLQFTTLVCWQPLEFGQSDDRNFDFGEGQELFTRFDSSGLLCRPVNTRSYWRVTPWTADLEDECIAVFRNVRNFLPVPHILVLWFLTPCRAVSLIQRLNVPSPHAVTLQVQVAQFSEVLEQTHYCTRCKNPEVINHMEQGPFWEANSSSASQIQRVLNPKFPNSVQKSSALVPA